MPFTDAWELQRTSDWVVKEEARHPEGSKEEQRADWARKVLRGYCLLEDGLSPQTSTSSDHESWTAASASCKGG